MVQNMSIKAAVLKYLEEHVNQRVFAADIAADLGITLQQVHGAINGLRKNPGTNTCLATVGQGVYVWSNHPVNGSGELFEKVGQTKTGKLVLQDEDGNVYLASPVE